MMCCIQISFRIDYVTVFKYITEFDAARYTKLKAKVIYQYRVLYIWLFIIFFKRLVNC